MRIHWRRTDLSKIFFIGEKIEGRWRREGGGDWRARLTMGFYHNKFYDANSYNRVARDSFLLDRHTAVSRSLIPLLSILSYLASLFSRR